jgi:hypothetical protein
MIYFQRIKASKDFLEDWSVFEESFWDDKDFIKIHESDMYITHDHWSPDRSVDVDVRIKGNVEVKYLYLPKRFDPGDDWTDEFRSIATQTVYSPQITFTGKAHTSSLDHQIVWTDFCDVANDWVDPADLDDADQFTEAFDASDMEPANDLKVEVVLLSGELRTRFYRAIDGEIATVFIYLPEDQLIRLVDQIASDRFEYIRASFTLPEFFLAKQKFNGFLNSWEGQQPYLMPNLTTSEQAMRNSIYLEERESINSSSDSVGAVDPTLSAVDSKLTPMLNDVVSEVRRLKIAVYTIAIVIVAFAFKAFF